MRVFYGKLRGKNRMGVIYADTDGLADRCACCGAKAGVEHEGSRSRYRCTDCCELGHWDADTYGAAIAWNLMQRKHNGKLHG